MVTSWSWYTCPYHQYFDEEPLRSATIMLRGCSRKLSETLVESRGVLQGLALICELD